ncbi:unnamed protein product [Lactuca saligna]|uniref:PC-Esterase n=1 Tax=Lactuca saligna TaxID=75948 RepID=A0AA35YEX8_LACSI|nr:unnamed protein product [Lactuca saligna]
MAACVVLFVPMAMAGWHLSRNKVLFFSGALFVSLAVCIHLIPYFPSVFPSSPTVLLQQDPTPCISLINEKLSRIDVSDLLNGSWIVVAGDSQARLFVVSLLDLVLSLDEMESIQADLFKRHSNYHIVVEEIGMKLDFIWAPYATNLTHVITDFKRNNTYPDVLVMGSGLWHMLHFTNYSDYGVSLRFLRESLIPFLPVGSDSTRGFHLFWLGMPTLINRMLNTEEKRVKMTSEMCNLYDQELYKSKILRKDGGVFLLLDVENLSKKCGVDCSSDGMHYNGVVYEACVHVMLNALLIESHQKL